MKLFYITNARLPNDKGHGIQIVKMAEAFHKKIGSSFQLVVPDKAQPKGFSNSIKDFYSLKEEIPINKLNIADPMFLSRFLPEVFERPLFDLQILFFGIISFVFAISRDGTFYTRDFYLVPFLLFAGKKVYYEAHYFPTTKAAIFFHRLLIPKLTGVIVLTKSFKTNYDNFGFKYRRLLVSPDATDPEFFNPVYWGKEGREISARGTGLLERAPFDVCIRKQIECVLEGRNQIVYEFIKRN